MLELDPKAARVTWTVAAVLLLIAAIYAIRGTIVLFVIALLFAYMLDPLVNQIDKHTSTKSRTPALAITYLLVIAIMSAFAYFIGAQLVGEIRQLMKHPPDIEGMLDHLVERHPELQSVINNADEYIREQMGEWVTSAPRVGLRMLTASASLVDIIIILILSFFILKDRSAIRNGFLAMFPHGDRRVKLTQTLSDVNDVLTRYVRALLTQCGLVLVVFIAALSAMGVPYALLLSTIAFFCEFVPLVGPLVAAILIMTVSALLRYPHLIWLLTFLGVFRIAQDYIIAPRVLGQGVRLHPMLIIFGVFAGGEIAGVAGIFLSVPLLALARMALTRLSRHTK